MKRDALPLFEGFIETPFEQRFQGLLRQAWKLRRWHVSVAEPGSGKTMGIRDLSAQASLEARMLGGRRYPVLAVTAPKNASIPIAALRATPRWKCVIFFSLWSGFIVHPSQNSI